MTSPDSRASFRRGVRLGLPYAGAGFLLSISFGVLAREAGMPALPAIAMSMILFAGSAQFAALSIIAAGGGVGAAVVAAGLMNSRFLSMGIALAPSLPGRPLQRAAQGQAVVDASWVLAQREDGTFDRWLLFGSTASQYVTWSLGTIVGVFAGSALPSAHDLGLDAIYPAFFLALLLTEVRRPGGLVTAVAAGILALALVPVVPAGLPVLAASLVALWGLTR